MSLTQVKEERSQRRPTLSARARCVSTAALRLSFSSLAADRPIRVRATRTSSMSCRCSSYEHKVKDRCHINVSFRPREQIQRSSCPHQQLQHALLVLQTQRLLLLNFVPTASDTLGHQLPDSAHQGLHGGQSSLQHRLVHHEQTVCSGERTESQS